MHVTPLDSLVSTGALMKYSKSQSSAVLNQATSSYMKRTKHDGCINNTTLLPTTALTWTAKSAH